MKALSRLTVRVPSEALQTLDSVAKSRGFGAVAEYLRDLVGRDSGVDLEIRPRGRQPKEKTSSG